MRSSFFKALYQEMLKDKNLFLMIGDVGYGVVEPFYSLGPKQFLNVGIAEQNMISMSAGVAHVNKGAVFIYSLANFPTLRALEQIRNDLCYHCANVKIIVGGEGLTYGPHGYSHWAIEDITILSSLPHLVVVTAGDCYEAQQLLKLSLQDKRPWVIRLGKNCRENLPLKNEWNKIDEVRLIQEGSKAILLTYGNIAFESCSAIKELDIACYSVPCLKPFPRTVLKEILDPFTHIFTVEEQQAPAPLYLNILQIMQEFKEKRNIFSLSLREEILGRVGDRPFLRESLGLDAQSMREFVSKRMGIL